MFSIQDGREHFYQWDLERKLVVDDNTITQVHFCNRTGECSLVCDTYIEDGLCLVNVPGVLLQDAWRINVYGFDKNYTKFSECFEVMPRTRPDDYVYTEEDIKTWQELTERIDQIEQNGVSDEAVGAAINKYMEENPIDLSDYALKSEIPDVSEFITQIPAEYVTEDELSAKGYAKASEIPDVSEYQTEAQVLALIKEHGGGSAALPASEEGAF